MNYKIFARGSLVLMTLVGVGCSNSGPPATEASFCEQKAERECGTATKGIAVNCGATVAACKVQRAAICNAWAATQKTATRPFRPDNIENCLNKTADAYSGVTILPSKRAIMDDACAHVFSGNNKGTLMDPACTDSLECAVGLICDKSLCVKMTVTSGQFCNDPGAVCPSGQYCMPVGAQLRCVPSRTAGQTCDAANPCVDLLRCSEGVCTGRVGVNLGCGSDADCVTEAPYCDPYSSCRCRPGFTPAPMVNECGVFGATDALGVAQLCPAAPGGQGGASGAGGAGGISGAAGSAGGAGGAGGAG